MKRPIAFFLVFQFLVVSLSAQQDIRLLTIDTAGPIINRNIYGQFAEHLGLCVYDGLFRNGQIRMDVVEALKKINVPLLRWPGGCFADNYHWKDGVGPLKDRAKTVNIMWGNVPEDNSFGTDEFLQLCHLIGCEPYLAGNMGTGSPEELESWIEYCNYKGTSDMAALRATIGHPDSYHVKYWGIGNESWGCGGRMTPETYTTKYKTFANYCRDYPGAPIMRIASGAENDDYNWTEYLLSHISPRWLQGVGVHYYTSAGGRTGANGSAITSGREAVDATDFAEDQYFHSLKNALRMDEIINGHAAIMDRFDPAKKIALIIDEWGIVVGDENSASYFYQQNSLRDALAAAATLNIFNNHCDRVRMANLAQIANVLQSLVLTSGDSLLLTPTYWVFDLFKVHQNAHSLVVKFDSPDYTYPATSPDHSSNHDANPATDPKTSTDPNREQHIPAVNCSASRDSTGAIHISLVNLDPTKTITIRTATGNLISKTVTGQILTSSHFTDINTFSQPDKVKPAPFTGAKKQAGELVVTLPPKSVVLLELH
jgi:alpha-N-arabinofuranosidase